MNKIYLYIIGCIVLGGILVCTGCLSTNSSIVHTPSSSPVFPGNITTVPATTRSIQYSDTQATNTTSDAQVNAYSSASYTWTPSVPEINTSICPSPTLIFNNSQPITQLQPGNFFFSTPYSNGTIPLGGIVYHSQRFTRVFDATGKQIMIINDSESITYSPAGPISTSYTAGLQGDAIPVDENNNITIIYSPGLSICEGTVITLPGVKPPVQDFEMH